MNKGKKNLKIRKANERGHTLMDWLNSYHSFSFGNYFEEIYMHFGNLRVINEDKIRGGAGFDLHPHKDMEIITYIIEGALEHKDSLGNVSVIERDEVQVMSAGSGIRHSEYNHLKDKETHFLQIWILPEEKGIKPRYGQKSFKEKFLKDNFVLVISKEAREGSIEINQEVDVYVGRFKAHEEMNFEIGKGEAVWIQMVKGEMVVNHLSIYSGDGLAVTNEEILNIKAQTDSEFLLFNLK
ncbi:MAG: quercetin 2,3-dioxygenase [Verrucomicrobia bacterium]|nr:MAG: quercetin 2,3-dioxygenase [Verrucomicrobiota bacterium]